MGAAFECWRYVNDEAELNVTTTLAPNELMPFGSSCKETADAGSLGFAGLFRCCPVDCFPFSTFCWVRVPLESQRTKTRVPSVANFDQLFVRSGSPLNLNEHKPGSQCCQLFSTFCWVRVPLESQQTNTRVPSVANFVQLFVGSGFPLNLNEQKPGCPVVLPTLFNFLLGKGSPLNLTNKNQGADSFSFPMATGHLRFRIPYSGWT